MRKPLDFVLRFYSVALLGSLVILTGCSKPSSSRPKSVIQTVYLGDPEKIYEGASTNRDLDVSIFDGVETVYLQSATSFDQKGKYSSAPLSQKNLEKENAAEQGENLNQGFKQFSVTRSSSREVATPDQGTTRANVTFARDLVLTSRDKHFPLKLAFSKIGQKQMIETTGYSWLVEISYENQTMVCGLVHFSVSTNSDHFSLLLSCFGNQDERSVYAIYFTKHASNVGPSQTAKKFDYQGKQIPFYYQAGPGYLSRFPKNQILNLDICGFAAIDFSSNIRRAVEQWKIALRDRLKINVSERSNYAPFTDLQQHCIYVVDDYMTNPDPRYANYGLTASVMDVDGATLMDSDVLIFGSEFLKSFTQFEDATLEQIVEKGGRFSSDKSFEFHYTLVHELGHFLGLDHQFDGVPSMMSYEFKEQSLTEYDSQAIQALYD